jgi:RHS repeat-associated protein
LFFNNWILSENGTLRHVHQACPRAKRRNSLSSTSLMTDASGNQIDTTVKYLPFGETRAGNVPTDKLFTGQCLDSTGLYYYNARYYDPLIGRFISADTFVQFIDGINYVSYQLTVNNLPITQVRIIFAIPLNPQSLNRYSYVLNNPLIYIDPTGHWNWGVFVAGAVLLVACVATGGILLAVTVPVLLTEIATAVTVTEIGLALWGIADIAAPCAMLAIGATTGGGLMFVGALEDTNTPQLPLEKDSSPPKYSYSVTFSDGSSGYYTTEQINQMQQIGTPITNTGTEPFTSVNFSDGSSGYFTPEQISAMAQYGIL